MKIFLLGKMSSPSVRRGMKTLLLKLDFMQRIARGEHVVAEE